MLDLPQKLETAAKALIDGAGLVTVFTGLCADEQVTPRAIVSAMTGREQPQGSGNFMVDLTVQVLSKADDSTIEEHRTLCISTIGLFMQDDGQRKRLLESVKCNSLYDAAVVLHFCLLGSARHSCALSVCGVRARYDSSGENNCAYAPNNACAFNDSSHEFESYYPIPNVSTKQAPIPRSKTQH